MTDIERVNALGRFDPPVFQINPHPFVLLDNNQYCGACGGGIMHEVHRMKPTIMARLESYYRSVPAEITDDDEIMLRIMGKIFSDLSTVETSEKLRRLEKLHADI